MVTLQLKEIKINKCRLDCRTPSQVMFALQVLSSKTHFNRQSLKQTAQVWRKTAKAVA